MSASDDYATPDAPLIPTALRDALAPAPEAPKLLKLHDDAYMLRSVFTGVWIIEPTPGGRASFNVMCGTIFAGYYAAGEFDPFEMNGYDQAQAAARARLAEIIERVETGT